MNKILGFRAFAVGRGWGERRSAPLMLFASGLALGMAGTALSTSNLPVVPSVLLGAVVVQMTWIAAWITKSLFFGGNAPSSNAN